MIKKEITLKLKVKVIEPNGNILDNNNYFSINDKGHVQLGQLKHNVTNIKCCGKYTLINNVKVAIDLQHLILTILEGVNDSKKPEKFPSEPSYDGNGFEYIIMSSGKPVLTLNGIKSYLNEYNIDYRINIAIGKKYEIVADDLRNGTIHRLDFTDDVNSSILKYHKSPNSFNYSDYIPRDLISKHANRICIVGLYRYLVRKKYIHKWIGTGI